MRRRTAAWVLALTSSLLVACSSGPKDDPGRAGPSASPDERLTIYTDGPHPIAAPPDKYFDLSHRLAGLADARDDDFSGSWYDSDTDQMVIGAATDKAEVILEHRGFEDSAELRIERVRWSLRDGVAQVEKWLKHSLLRDRAVMYGTLPQGDGFLIGIEGDELSDAERADLLELPGRVELETGESPAVLD